MARYKVTATVTVEVAAGSEIEAGVVAEQVLEKFLIKGRDRRLVEGTRTVEATRVQEVWEKGQPFLPEIEE